MSLVVAKELFCQSFPAPAKLNKLGMAVQLTCTTNSAGAALSPYSKPLTKPNSTGTSLLLGRGACFLAVSLPLLCADVAVPASACPLDSDVAVCACSIGAPSLVAGVDEPQPISELLLAGRTLMEFFKQCFGCLSLTVQSRLWLELYCT